MRCIVAVNGRLNVNVALNRPAYQSGIRDFGYVVAYPALAVDGNSNTDFHQYSCIHTLEQANPWWAVDLGVKLYVRGVKFTNRGDCCGTYTTSTSRQRPKTDRETRAGFRGMTPIF